MCFSICMLFFFSSERRHTSGALVTGVQTCALPIWYHSHVGLQEQRGHYGPIVIDPAGADPIGYVREHVVVLSDHSQISPEAIFRKLKVNPGHFNMQRQTLSGLLAGKDQSLKERIDWGKMRMDPTDVADVNGSTYTFLVNGHGPRDNWTALFSPGERVRLRIVNASAMTIFNVRIPGLRMRSEEHTSELQSSE